MKKKSKRKKIGKKKVLSPNSEPAKPGFGPFPSPNSELKLRIRVRPGYFSNFRTCQTRVGPIPFFELRTCQTRVQPCLFSELRTCQTRVRPIPFSELQTCGTRVWSVPFSELRTCLTRVRPDPFSELQTKTPNQSSARSFLRTPNRNSELGLKIPSWTKLINRHMWVVEPPFKNIKSKYCSSVVYQASNIQAISKGSDHSVRMRRLVRAFAYRTYHIVGNLMLCLIYGPPWCSL